jgi:hypothetical protein
VFDTDLKSILSGEFTETVEFTLGGFSVNINCIYDDTFLLVDKDGAPVQSQYPRLTVFAQDIELEFSAPLSENTGFIITARGIDYTIRHRESDGQGMTLLPLRKVE